MKLINKNYIEYIEGMEYKDAIIIDAPWDYNDKGHPKVKASTPYGRWSNKDLDWIFTRTRAGFIFMWVTNAMLEEVFRRNTFSTFTYAGMLTWVKTTKTGKLFYGMGMNFRNCTEQLLIFRKAKPLHSAMRNLWYSPALPRTGKPRVLELFLLNEVERVIKHKGQFAYLFSGNTRLEPFKNIDIDLVDIEINKNGEKIY